MHRIANVDLDPYNCVCDSGYFENDNELCEECHYSWLFILINL